jgi:hypothetical protein
MQVRTGFHVPSSFVIAIRWLSARNPHSHGGRQRPVSRFGKIIVAVPVGKSYRPGDDCDRAREPSSLLAPSPGSGGNYRLIVAFKFSAQDAFIKFIGTHVEYDRVAAATVSDF